MKIQLKRSSVTEANGWAKAPSDGQMEYGELAVNYGSADPAIFMKDSADNVIRISGREVPSDSTPPENPLAGNFWYNPNDGRLYIYYTDADSSQWVDASPDNWDPTAMPDISNPSKQPGTLDDRYVNLNGDDMSGNLTLGTDKITLNSSSGNADFTGEVSANTGDFAGTVISDAGFRVDRPNGEQVQIGGSDTAALYTKDSKISLNHDGNALYAGKITTAATVNGDNNTTVTTKGYVDTKVSSVPTPGDGTITISQTGEADQSFSVNQTGNQIINLKNDTVTPGDGTITVIQPGTSNQTFSVNQSGNTTVTLKDTTPGDGTITVVQPGTANQTFSVNQSGNTTITLKDETPNNGQINVSAGTGLSVTGSNATANQSGNTTRTLSLDTAYTDDRYAQKGTGTVVLISTIDANNATTVDITGINNTYSSYIVKMTNGNVAVTSGQSFYCQFFDDNGVINAGAGFSAIRQEVTQGADIGQNLASQNVNYVTQNAMEGWVDGASFGTIGLVGGEYLLLSNEVSDTDNICSMELSLMSPGISSRYHNFTWNIVTNEIIDTQTNKTKLRNCIGCGAHFSEIDDFVVTGSSTITGVRIFASKNDGTGANLSGKFQLYGVQ